MTNRIIKSSLFYTICLLIIAFWSIPFIWMILNSFKSSQAIIEGNMTLLFQPTLEHYQHIFATQDFLGFASNSISVALASTAVSVVFGTLTAYSISRFATGGRGFEFWVLATRMAPPAVLIIPFFLMFRTLDLINTVWVLVIANTTFNLSFVIWTMRGFLDEVPIEIEESAMIDGCTRLMAMWQVLLPIVRPGLIATTIFTLIFSWNEYLFALTLATASDSKTLPVAAGDFITGYAINWGPVFASGTLILFPIFVIVLLLQRHIVRGLSLGAFK